MVCRQDTRYAWRVTRGHGIDGRNDGVLQHNLVATYAHLRSVAGTDWARHFVDFVRARRASQRDARGAAQERLAA